MSVVDDLPRLAKNAGGGGRDFRPAVPVLGGLALCLLLAVVQIAWAGYQLGVGNQGIQIAFLKHYANPSLFAHDEMVRQTLPLYPSYFFRLLAPLLHIVALDPLYFTLQVLTTFLTLAMVYVLGRSIFRSHASALAAVAILVAGHHRALAGDTLYSAGFTHTYVALPFAIGALALAYRDGGRRMVWAFALAGVLFDLHALTAAYVLLMLCAALLADRREMPWGAWARRVALCGIVAIALAAPTLAQMLGQHQVFDAAWVNLMRVRSAEHSFPATWWASGNPDLPRFALLLALFALSWSFGAVRRGERDGMRALNVSRWMTVAVLALFAAGYVFTELVPTPLIIRLQPFRASRLLMVLMFVHIAHAAVVAIRAGWTGRTPAADGEQLALAKAMRVLELAGGILVLATLAVPALLPLLPFTVAAVTVVALISGRLSWRQAIIAAGALLIAVLAYRQIQFPLPFLSRGIAWFPRDAAGMAEAPLAAGALFAAAILALFIALARPAALRWILIAATFAIGGMFMGILFQQQLNAPPTGPAAALGPVAQWAEAKTPKDAVFLTPTGYSMFRILSDRALVADWRDGTQLYFSADFAPEWFTRVSAIEPGLTLSPDNARLVARGKPLATLDTDALVALAKKYHASYILLPTPPAQGPANQERPLEVAFSDPHYTVYTLTPAVAAVPAGAAVPKGVIHPAEWLAMQKFMQTTVAQNIDRYRKSDLTVQILDPQGRPVQDLPAVINQTRHAFNFGMSLGFFEPNTISSQGDQKGAPVTPRELALMPECFNASMTPFSGKWMYTEPVKDQPTYSDLDKYIDFCAAHRITVEYHFLTGLAPMWLRGNQAEQMKRLPAHAMALVDRYHDRVQYWQLANERYNIRAVPAIYKEIHAKYPELKLGIADCVKFYSGDENPIGKHMDMYQGVQMIPWLKNQGVHLDFFGIHGHRPYGLWADPRTMYEVMDNIAKLGVKLHITEMLLPLGQNIIGPVRRGTWTPELQADFFAEYLTVCFSHPDVELVNFWGLVHSGWGESAGILDDHDNPRPAFERLKHLINDVWHTRLEGPLPLDGTLHTRAFHGDYELSLTLADGRNASAAFSVPADTPATNVRFCLDSAKGTLTVMPAGK